MNTAMQELLDKLKAMLRNGGDKDLIPAIKHAEDLLIKEKEQIMDAYWSGFESGRPGRPKCTAQGYYDKTFKP